MMKRTAAAVCGAVVLAAGMTGCARIRRLGVEGRGQRRAAGHAPGRSVGSGGSGRSGREGRRRARRRRVHGHGQRDGYWPRDRQAARAGSSCLETAQEGESQSRGGYEAIRDGKFAAMIEAAQCWHRRDQRALPSPRRASGRRWRTRSRRQKPPPRKQEQGIPMTKQVHGQTGAHAPLSRRDFLTRAGLTVEPPRPRRRCRARPMRCRRA